jgi:hypothetical protein
MERLDADPGQPVLYHFTQWIQFPDMPTFAPELFEHLVANYRIARVFTDDGWGYMMAALEREPEADAPGEPLFEADLEDAEVHGETADGQAIPIDAAERDDWLRRETWPFRRVLALRPRAQGESTVVSTALRVPENARLETAIGVHPRRWFKFPPSTVRFAIRVVHEGRREEVFQRTLDPHPKGAERGWFPVEVPLDRWAGETVRIELAVGVERESSAVLEMGGFAWPRLVTEAAPVAGSTP